MSDDIQRHIISATEKDLPALLRKAQEILDSEVAAREAGKLPALTTTEVVERLHLFEMVADLLLTRTTRLRTALTVAGIILPKGRKPEPRCDHEWTATLADSPAGEFITVIAKALDIPLGDESPYKHFCVLTPGHEGAHRCACGAQPPKTKEEVHAS